MQNESFGFCGAVFPGLLSLRAGSPGGLDMVGDFEFFPEGNGLTITRYKGSAAVVNIPPSIDGIPVTAIGDGAFDGCSSLTGITLPAGVTVIGDYAFSGCSSLTGITIPASVTTIGYAAFDGCSSLTAITVDAGNRQYRDINGILFSKDGKTLMCYPAGKTCTSYTIPDGVTAIGHGAFDGCSSLTGITLPDGVTAIGDYAFFDCSSLTGITLPDGVTAIGYMAFSGCSSLADITIPASVTTIEDFAFWDCSSLPGITIPDGVTVIGHGAFTGCSSLTAITVDAGNRQYRGINGILFSKGGKTLVRYPAGKTGTSYTIPAGVTNIGERAFTGCSSLTAITVDAGNRQYRDINGVLFSKDGKTLVCYPAGKTYTSYTIPDGVTAIGDLAFIGCSSLTGITIPNSVTAIGERAFADCDSLSAADREAIGRRFGDGVF
jgi:hypothetical protein